MIKEYEYYHGAVFTSLIHQCKDNLAIKPYPSSAKASYILNDKIGIYIKYSAKRLSPWIYSFQKKHQDEILEMKNDLTEVFLLLICGEDGIVVLRFDEIKKILNEVHCEVEWISASRNPNKEYTIKGSDGALGRKVGKNDFPKKVLKLLSSVA